MPKRQADDTNLPPSDRILRSATQAGIAGPVEQTDTPRPAGQAGKRSSSANREGSPIGDFATLDIQLRAAQEKGKEKDTQENDPDTQREQDLNQREQDLNKRQEELTRENIKLLRQRATFYKQQAAFLETKANLDREADDDTKSGWRVRAESLKKQAIEFENKVELYDEGQSESSLSHDQRVDPVTTEEDISEKAQEQKLEEPQWETAAKNEMQALIDQTLDVVCQVAEKGSKECTDLAYKNVYKHLNETIASLDGQYSAEFTLFNEQYPISFPIFSDGVKESLEIAVKDNIRSIVDSTAKLRLYKSLFDVCWNGADAADRQEQGAALGENSERFSAAMEEARQERFAMFESYMRRRGATGDMKEWMYNELSSHLGDKLKDDDSDDDPNVRLDDLD